MGTTNQKYDELSKKLENIIRKQELFQYEIYQLQQELDKLKASDVNTPVSSSAGITAPETDTQPVAKASKPAPTAVQVNKEAKVKPKRTTNFERFIGENLFNKIGIVILIIGVAIGAKYAIDNQLIGPQMRIILGYVLGLGLLGFAIKLKKKYEGFSAVLLSGSFAILYFITYAAFSFYSLIPQGVTFGFLVFITIATVAAAINYNRQIIAHIGLVGAYAIPFLFDSSPEEMLFYFNYTALINAGILTIAILRYWKLLYLSAFSITWLLYSSWYAGAFKPVEHFKLAFVFLTIYFVLFFSTFIVYKLRKLSKFDFLDIVLVVINSFIFYGLGYSLLSTNDVGKDYLGLFTLTTAAIHFIVALIIYKNKLADRNLFYLVAGMVLIFITIAFPVQFDGGWVTMFWAGEAVILFWIGRSKGVKIYEYISYPLIILAFISIVQDWSEGYGTYVLEDPESRITPFFNITFLTSVFVISCYSVIFSLRSKARYINNSISSNSLIKTMGVITSILIVLTIFFAFWTEIANYWKQLYTDSYIKLPEGSDYPRYKYNYDLKDFKTVWLWNYILLFMSVLTVLSINLKTKKAYAWIIFGFNALILLIYLPVCLYQLSELRESYLEQSVSEYYNSGIYNILIRYISFVFIALILVSTYRLYIFLGKKLETGFHLLVSGTLLWVLSSEVLHWFDIASVPNSYKIGLSIFWGVYAMLMVVYGIKYKKTHLRIAAFGILGFTLLKLFIYDLSHMSAISRALIFILLGIVFLGISFLYNKYKKFIFDDN